MVVNMNDAINAYATATRAARPADVKPDAFASAKTDPKANFSDFVKASLEESRETMKQSEMLTQKAVMGEASLHEVVTAVSAAEVTLQSVVSVRDKMIQSYQTIMRMPI